MTGPAPALRFRVTGLPIPQGSKRIGKRGKKAIILDDNDKVLKPWRKSVTDAAELAIYPQQFTWQPIVGPVRIAVLFGFARPASHPKGRRTWPTGIGTVGDVDKLARAVMDACTDAKVWRDDALVVELHTVKDWCGYGAARLLTVPGCVVRIWRITDDPPSSGQIPLLAQQERTTP